MHTLSYDEGREEGPSAASRGPSANGRVEFLGTTVYSGCPQQATLNNDLTSWPNHIVYSDLRQQRSGGCTTRTVHYSGT